MHIRLQPYSFNLVFKPRKELFLADTLSISFCEYFPHSFDDEAHVAMITKSFPSVKTQKENFLRKTIK